MACLQSALARLGPIDVPCVVEDVRTFLVGPPHITAVFRRPDGRLHRVSASEKEIVYPDEVP